MSSIPDPHHIANGREIPGEGYADQPYVVQTDDGAWLCVMTTGPGRECRGRDPRSGLCTSPPRRPSGPNPAQREGI